MRAVQLSRFGGPELFEIVDIPTPVPGPGEVLVRMQAAGINFFEALMRANRYAVTPDLPMIPGVEVAGIVEAAGPGVATPAVGARVAVPLFAIGRPTGGYAEYVAVDAASTVPLPDALSFEDAVALMVQGLTALHLARRASPQDKTLLVTAAGGGVGTLLVQLARRAGARRLIAAAGSQDKLALAHSLGADLGVDYTRPDWPAIVRDATGGKGVDIIHDLVGGETTRAGLALLAPDGTLVFSPLGRFALTPADMERLFAANQTLSGFALLPLLTPEGMQSDLRHLFDLAVRGGITVVRGGRFPLAEVAAAHRLLDSRRSTGKIVLVP